MNTQVSVYSHSQTMMNGTEAQKFVVLVVPSYPNPLTFLFDTVNSDCIPMPKLPSKVNVAAMVHLTNGTVTILGEEYEDDNQVSFFLFNQLHNYENPNFD